MTEQQNTKIIRTILNHSSGKPLPLVRVPFPLLLPGLANPKFARPTTHEVDTSHTRRNHYRVIGGDLGDLFFDGFELGVDHTLLVNPHLVSVWALESTDDELMRLAEGVLHAAFASIGWECLEHN